MLPVGPISRTRLPGGTARADSSILTSLENSQGEPVRRRRSSPGRILIVGYDISILPRTTAQAAEHRARRQVWQAPAPSPVGHSRRSPGHVADRRRVVPSRWPTGPGYLTSVIIGHNRPWLLPFGPAVEKI